MMLCQCNEEEVAKDIKLQRLQELLGRDIKTLAVSDAMRASRDRIIETRLQRFC